MDETTQTDETAATPPPEPTAAPADPAVQPVAEALHQALREVDSFAKAEAVLAELSARAATQTTAAVAQEQPADLTPAAAAQQVAQAAAQAPPGEKASPVLTEAAQVLAAPPSAGRTLVAEAAQAVLNPEQQGLPAVEGAVARDYLRQAVVKRLQGFDALDVQLFLRINHLPHTRRLNGFFAFLTRIFTGGAAWYGLMGVITLCRPRWGWLIIRRSALPLAVATALVEYPIKAYFRRRRPFIHLIQAIVIGQKPGSWSFPSGHSATAFAGAWLLGRHWPRARPLFYLVASLVAFSRIYLGVHYPGDVIAGSAGGVGFAWLCARLLRRSPRPPSKPNSP